jgi:hypothetical protein
VNRQQAPRTAVAEGDLTWYIAVAVDVVELVGAKIFRKPNYKTSGWRLKPAQSDFCSLFEQAVRDMSSNMWLFDLDSFGSYFYADIGEEEVNRVQALVTSVRQEREDRLEKARRRHKKHPYETVEPKLSLEEKGYIVLEGRALFPDLIKTISDDWNGFLALRDGVPLADVAHRFATGSIVSWGTPELTAEQLGLIDTIFENVDGAYWAFYTASRSRREALMASVRQCPGAQVQEAIRRVGRSHG